MNFALIYHYWNDSRDAEVWRDLANPVILSIATFRAHNLQIPIYVIDCSSKRNDWSYFPFKLKFEVLRRNPALGHAGMNRLSSSQIKLFSRAFDVPALAAELEEPLIAFCDSDIFWVKDMLPFPLPIEGFYCNRSNNGFYYYSKGTPSVGEFFARWQTAIHEGIEDNRKRQEILTYYYSSVFNDEAAYCYIKQTTSGLVKDLSAYDNWAALHPGPDVIENTKNYHLCQSLFGKRRGLMGLVIKEFYKNLRVFLDDADMVRIFGERNMYLACNFGVDQLHKAKLVLNDKRKLFS